LSSTSSREDRSIRSRSP